MADISYHYHARLECGHQVGFDATADLFGIAVEGGADDVVVTLPCTPCGGVERDSTDVMPGGQDIKVCLTCGKGTS